MIISEEIAVVFGHPNRKSLTGALVDEFLEAYNEALYKPFDEQVIVHSINTFCMDINDPLVLEKNQSIIKSCDKIIFAFPVWWELPPHTLVHFIQAVFGDGFAYSYDEAGNRIQPLKGKKLITLITQGQDRVQCTLIENFDFIAEFCGFDYSTPVVFSGVKPNLSPETVEKFKTKARFAGTALANQ